MPISFSKDPSTIKFDLRRARKEIATVLDELSLSDKEVGILLADNAVIRAYNLKYLGRDRPTNVISFGNSALVGGSYLGDIVVSVERAREEADDWRHDPYEHTIYLIIHGILHLIGYDHEAGPVKARKMTRIQTRLFTGLFDRLQR